MNPFDYIPSYIPNPSEAGLIIGAGIIGLLILLCGIWAWLAIRPKADYFDEHGGLEADPFLDTFANSGPGESGGSLTRARAVTHGRSKHSSGSSSFCSDGGHHAR